MKEKNTSTKYLDETYIAYIGYITYISYTPIYPEFSSEAASSGYGNHHDEMYSGWSRKR